MTELRLSENALTVLKKRYLAKDENGKPVETPEQMFHRVARNIALMDLLFVPEAYTPEPASRGKIPPSEPIDPSVSFALKKAGVTPQDLSTLRMAYNRLFEEGHMKIGFGEVLALFSKYEEEIMGWEKRLYDLMATKDFMFNSPTLMNAGRDLQQLSACFVLPVDDDLGMIFEALKQAALIHQSGGGTGFSFSRLRPKNDIVRSTGGVASGPVSFMKVFNAATEAVKQGGTRRGANMGILRVDHPDILEFIICKSNGSEITNFNISVAITDEFMKALEEDGEYELINPRNKEVTGKLRAREVFQLICENAWRNGDPGVVFIDRINRDNPTPLAGSIESTNPCGEQPLLPHEACTLGSINLGNFVIRGDEPRVDYQRLEQVVRDSIHALDNVLEANKYPIPEIEKMVRANRKVGLGVMGWADMLLWLGIPYDSEEALALAREVASFINRTAVEASVALGESRGVFPNWKGSIFDRPGGPRRRNATVTTIAPTGTISILAGASTGIEPLFSLAFTRHVLDGAELVEVNPIFEEVARSRGFYSEELIQKIARQGNLHGLDEVPEDIRRLFVTAHDISPEWHVRMQAAFQEYTENAVSKTINMPHEATVEDVARAYVLAYKLGCKGITVYRDRSRETQVLTTGAKTRAAGATAKEEPGVNPPINGGWGKIRPIPRPRRLYGITDVKVTPLGKLFLTLNLLDGHPVELFAQIGKAGSDVSAFTEAIARLISLALRSGIAPEEVADQLTGIGGARSVGFGPQRVRSVPDAIGQFISEFINAEKEASHLSQGAPGVPVWPPQTRHEEGPGDDTGFESRQEKEGKAAGREEQPGATKKEPSITRASAPSRQVPGGAIGAGCAEEKGVVTGTRLEGKSGAARGSKQQDERTKSMAGRNAGSSSETAAAQADFDPSRSRNLFNLCPSCGIYAFAYVEGCSKCFACGYSEC